MKPKGISSPKNMQGGTAANVFSLPATPRAPSLATGGTRGALKVVPIDTKRKAKQLAGDAVSKTFELLLLAQTIAIDTICKRQGISPIEFGIAYAQKLADHYAQKVKP